MSRFPIDRSYTPSCTVTVGKCKILLTTHGGLCRRARTSDWPSCRCWPRRSWLHHYLAFECPIREIAAVSDRHCLATDSPRTCTQRYQLLLHRFTRRCVLFTPFLCILFLTLSYSHCFRLNLPSTVTWSLFDCKVFVLVFLLSFLRFLFIPVSFLFILQSNFSSLFVFSHYLLLIRS